MTKQVCKVCKKTKDRTHDESRKVFCSEGYPKKYFIDESGETWRGFTCGPCYKNGERIKNHINGKRKPIDMVVNCSTARGRKSERIAESFFNSLGYKSELTTGIGPDITLCDGTKVEVKTAYRTGYSIVVGSVSKKRVCDDIICIVYPDGEVFIDTMGDHLRSCCKSGKRTITDHAKINGKYEGFFL